MHPPLFGSNTPGAMINLINKTGGDGSTVPMRATGATQGLARFDLNANGPLGDDWRFNVGGFYRYDHGVRDPGFPGIRGGQVKAQRDPTAPNGYLRLSAKVHRRPQPVHSRPAIHERRRPDNSSPGFGNYGSMNTMRGSIFGCRSRPAI